MQCYGVILDLTFYLAVETLPFQTFSVLYFRTVRCRTFIIGRDFAGGVDVQRHCVTLIWLLTLLTF